MGSYVLRRSYPKHKLGGKNVFSEQVTFWSIIPDDAFGYDKRFNTFWNPNLDEHVVRSSYLWIFLKWKFSREKLESPFTYGIIKEDDALVSEVMNE